LHLLNARFLELRVHITFSFENLILPQASGLLCDERMRNGCRPEEHARGCPVKPAALRPKAGCFFSTQEDV
jgi:hypothetical protein